MPLGAVDLGSNSLKYLVADPDGDELTVVDQGERLVRVAEGLEENGALHDDAIARTLEALAEIQEIFGELEVRDVRAVATAGLRGASNAARVLEGARALGIELEIISPEREARLAFVGPANLYGPGPVAVFDVGGRSTEITIGTATNVENVVSLPLGGVRLTESFLHDDPPAPRDLEALRAHVRDVLEGAPPLAVDVPLIGVSATAHALFGHAYDVDLMSGVLERAEGRRLTIVEVQRSLGALAAVKADQRCLSNVIPPRRADVIVAGAALIAGILAHYKRLFFVVSTRGVRYGLIQEMIG